jgi:diphthamide biosynthesis protein 7
MTCTLATTRTDYMADAVAFCPHGDVLACGCYQLSESGATVADGIRLGHVELYATGAAACSTSPGGAEAGAEAAQLRRLGTVGSTGILDCAWSEKRVAGGASILAAACSDGRARIFSIDVGIAGDDAGTAPAPATVASLDCAGAGVCMSLAWGCPAAGTGDRLALSSTAGKVYVADTAVAGMALLSSWDAHSDSSWAVAFDPVSPHLLYSGGDDAAFKLWDLRDDGAGGPATSTGANTRSHGAGVCCISPLVDESTRGWASLVVTGSYDEMARLWDCRALRVRCAMRTWKGLARASPPRQAQTGASCCPTLTATHAPAGSACGTRVWRRSVASQAAPHGAAYLARRVHARRLQDFVCSHSARVFRGGRQWSWVDYGAQLHPAWHGRRPWVRSRLGAVADSVGSIRRISAPAACGVLLLLRQRVALVELRCQSDAGFRVWLKPSPQCVTASVSGRLTLAAQLRSTSTSLRLFVRVPRQLL